MLPGREWICKCHTRLSRLFSPTISSATVTCPCARSIWSGDNCTPSWFSLQCPLDPVPPDPWDSWPIPPYLSLPCLRLLWLTLKPVCFWAASVLWLLWTRKPWRNAAEPGRMARTQARLRWVPIKMELLLLTFFSTCKCFGTEYISSEKSFIAVPPLYSSNSLFLFPLFSLPLSLYPPGADIGLSELACFGKMQAQETA